MHSMKARHRKAADRLTHADLVVLAMLAEKPTHGYDIVAVLERREGGSKSPVSRAQIYYSLKKLHGLGLVLVARDSGPAVGPEREPYRLSSAGRSAIGGALSSPEWAGDRPPIPFQTWLMVLGHAAPKDRAAALQARRARLDEQIEKEAGVVEQLRSRDGSEAQMPLAVALHRVEILRMERQLLDAVEPMLGGHPEQSLVS